MSHFAVEFGPYQLYIPLKKEKLPLIIHLHGSGEAGNDNFVQMYSGTNYGPQYFASEENQSIQEAFVLAPQTPAHIRWASTTLEPYIFQKTSTTVSMKALLRLIDTLPEKFPVIDIKRIYIAGLSRGGQGVWNALMLRPDFFAAGVAISGSADPREAARIANIPIWAFASDSDQTTNVQFTRDMVDALIRNGGSSSTVRYTEVEGGDHAGSWQRAYENSDVYKWLIRQSK